MPQEVLPREAAFDPHSGHSRLASGTTASSPKYQLLHYARMSAINDTTPTHAQSHGSDHLSLVSSFGADNEEQKQFAKFQGHR